MQEIQLRSVNDFAEWRAAARLLLRSGIPPAAVTWADPAMPHGLFDDTAEAPAPHAPDKPAGRAPRRFITLARSAICHSDPDRFALLYRLLWRLQKDRAVLANRSDVDVGKLYRRVDDVAREVQRIEASLHFRHAVSGDGHHGLAAWFEPKHYVLELVASHFAHIHRDVSWEIATPYRTVWWDRKALTFGPGSAPPPAHGRALRNLFAAPVIPPEEAPREEGNVAVSLVDHGDRELPRQTRSGEAA